MTEQTIDQLKVKRIRIMDQHGRVCIQWDVEEINISLTEDGKFLTMLCVKDYQGRDKGL